VSGAKARVESLSHREYGHAGDVIHRGHASARRNYGEAILVCMYIWKKKSQRPSNLSALGQTHVAPHDSASASCSDQFTVRCKNVAKSKNLVDCGMIRTLNLLIGSAESRSNGKMTRTGAENQRLGH
jgi:hypothetical protein